MMAYKSDTKCHRLKAAKAYARKIAGKTKRAANSRSLPYGLYPPQVFAKFQPLG
jgi:hypothetical protein